MDFTAIAILLTLVAALAAAAGGGVSMLRRSRRTEKELFELRTSYAQLESRVENLQLETLESKLDPHLFKNVLNTIQSHAFQTYHALDKLSNVLDFVLYESKKRFVSPKEEVEFALNLIEINKIKLSPLFDLNVKTKIDEADPLYNKKLLAPLISIDLIQNAFKHVDLQGPGAFISIVFEFKGGDFTLTVANTASSREMIEKEHGGLGAEALAQRLKILYKSNFHLERHRDAGVYFAQLRIHLDEHQAQVPAVG